MFVEYDVEIHRRLKADVKSEDMINKGSIHMNGPMNPQDWTNLKEGDSHLTKEFNRLFNNKDISRRRIQYLNMTIHSVQEYQRMWLELNGWTMQVITLYGMIQSTRR